MKTVIIILATVFIAAISAIALLGSEYGYLAAATTMLISIISVSVVGAIIERRDAR